MQVRSPAFENGSEIPARYTSDSDDVSPPLVWVDAPSRTKSFALIIDDPDAPDPAAPLHPWVHWLVYNIPADVTSIAEGPVALPDGAREGLNDWGHLGYEGPCPPIGRHRYYHRLYALDAPLSLPQGARRPELERAIHEHVLATAELVGTYEKKQSRRGR